MSQTLPMPMPRSPIPVPHPRRDLAEAWRQVQALSHFRADYAYQLGLHEYTETHTDDPCYAVADVQQALSLTSPHSDALKHFQSAENILLPAGCHMKREVLIHNIPAAYFAHAPRHTGSVYPDMAIWGPDTPEQRTYDYARVGAPLAVLEVLSHSSVENDQVVKRAIYARMGVREYYIQAVENIPERWNVPELAGYVLDSATASYRRIAAGPDGGLYSAVLDRYLRGQGGRIQCWQEPENRWIDVQALSGFLADKEKRVEDLLLAAFALGAFASPAERDGYREKLWLLSLDQIPAVENYLKRIHACPEGPPRAVAAKRLLDATLQKAPEGSWSQAQDVSGT